jgi:outer membrane protein assembly factor BamD
MKAVAALIWISVAVGCGGPVNLATKPANELYSIGMKAYNEKKYLSAIEHLQAVVFNHGGVSFVDTAQYHLALSYYGNKDYTVAGVEFNRLALNYPSSVYFQNAIFLRAVCFFESTPKHYGLDQSELQKAIEQFEDFLIDYPESELVPQAREYLSVAQSRMARKFYESAVVYRRIGAYLAAIKYYQVVLDSYTESIYAPKALFEMSEINLHLKKFPEAQAGFSNFVTLYKEHELADRAIKLSREAAFKSGVYAFDRGEMTTAKERFEAYIKEYPNDDKVEDAREYLSRIGDKQSLLSEDGHADS